MQENKLKVIIIGPAHPLRGGLATYNERLCREWLLQGHDCSIITFSLQYPGFLFPGTTQYSEEPAPKDLRIRVMLNSINPINWILSAMRIRKMQADLVIVRYWLPFMGPCLGSVLRLLGKKTKIICIADNIIPHEKRFMDHAFTRYFVKPIDGFITMSEKVLDDLKQFSQKPARYVPHPVYDTFGDAVDKKTACQQLKLDEGFRYFLFFGFIRKYKGLDLLFEVIAQLKEHHFFEKYPVRFLIAGEFYEDRSGYDALVQRLQIADYLEMHTHFINDSEVKFYFSASEVVIQPYRNATQSGITPLSYFYNKPTIVTQVGGLAKFVKHGQTGLIADADVNSLCEQIEHFAELPENTFKEEIIAAKKNFTWDNITQTMLKLCE
jgi:glycosyltransferase involved in cell wall biosynthesis